MKEFTVRFHLADSGYMTALRLVAGAVCALRDVDVEAAEDFKVCVTESAIILKDCGFESAKITFEGGDGAVCSVEGEGGAPSECENEFSLALISALVSDCGIERAGGAIKKITLKI